MGNCNCCEEEPQQPVTTMYPHQNPNNAVQSNHHFPPVANPSAPPFAISEQPPVATIYPPLPPQSDFCSTPVPAGPSYFWSASRFGGVPPMAVKAGTDKTGEEIYVGRAYHEGDTLPAKIIRSHQCSYVAWGGAEHRKDTYDVLCAENVSWHTGRHGEVPDHAVPCGQTSSGESLFIGRVFHDGTLTPGKIHPSHGSIYIPYGGQELAFPEYEVLVIS